MRDVIDLYSQSTTDREGNVSLVAARLTNPLAHLWEGLQLYARLMRRNISEIREAEAKKRK